MSKRVVAWLVEYAILFVCWQLFVGRLDRHETLVGIAAAALGTVVVERVRGTEHPRFYPYLRWILEAWRIPGEILHDYWLVTRKLARMIFAGDRRTGYFVRVPFRAGGGGARAIARRALAITYTTLPPNSLVIGIDRERNEMLLHVLEKADPPAMIAILEGKK